MRNCIRAILLFLPPEFAQHIFHIPQPIRHFVWQLQVLHRWTMSANNCNQLHFLLSYDSYVQRHILQSSNPGAQHQVQIHRPSQPRSYNGTLEIYSHKSVPECRSEEYRSRQASTAQKAVKK